MLIAVPSETPGGLEAKISKHFGHCDTFTLVQLDDEQVGEVTVIENEAHQQGKCTGPVMLLKGKGVEALVAGGMGQRPLAGFEAAGIRVLFNEGAATVGEAIDKVIAGECREFGDEHTCGGHGGGGGCGHDHGHDHQQIQRDKVDGPVEKDRVVFISFTVSDGEGQQLDDVDGIGYLHGHGQIAPGLERGLEGLSAGDSFDLTVEPQDAYGERSDGNLHKVPLDQLPEGLEAGSVVQAQSPHGGVIPLVVVELGETEATLDANHPLAGKDLVFEIELVEVA